MVIARTAGLGGRTPEPSSCEDSARDECQYVLLAAPLPWAVSDADHGMTRVRWRLQGKCVPRELPIFSGQNGNPG
jgi:hypothetical protein